MKTIQLTTQDFFKFKALAQFIYQYAYNKLTNTIDVTANEIELNELGY
jgi:hypothetical protein